MNGLSRSPASTSRDRAPGRGSSSVGVATTMPRGDDGASSAMSDRPARNRCARSAREPGAVEQLVDEVVARRRRVDAAVARDAERACGREHVRHGHDRLSRARRSAARTPRGRSSSAPASTGSRSTVRGSGSDTEHRLDACRRRARRSRTTSPASPAASSDGTSSGTYGVARTWRSDSSATRGAHRRRARSRRARRAARCSAHVSNVSGPSTRLSGTRPASSSACAARPSRPAGLDRGLHRRAVRARERRADELPHPRERQARRERLLRDDEPGARRSRPDRRSAG